jgi:cellulose synthase/poly-beta-1,6-N-acetylglucosamine synthase-like glycosyltransferase
VTAGPRVGVVIPALDDAPALDRCLTALARQSMPPAEVLVVDNGSTDATPDVALRHGARLLHEPRRGIGAAASRGYDAVEGDLIGRLDADSVPPQHWLETMTAAVLRPGVDAATGLGRFGDAGWWARPAMTAYLGSYYALTTAALGHLPVWGSSCVLRAETWQRVGPSVHRDDAEVHDDMDLSFALGARAKVVLVRDAVVEVSSRSVRGGPQWSRRWRRALRTIEVNRSTAPTWWRPAPTERS